MEASFCVETLEDALARHGRPEIFNTDQGSQFTGAAFTGVLAKHEIKISMDGKGAWRDNVFVEIFPTCRLHDCKPIVKDIGAALLRCIACKCGALWERRRFLSI